MWTGCLTALITPFRDRRVDYDALGAIAARFRRIQARAGRDALAASILKAVAVD